MQTITAIILTYNEELHIARCIKSIENAVDDIVIVDCYSSDKTVEIVSQFPKVRVFQHKWLNYATQFNWGLENCHIQSDWIWRIDADEYIDDELGRNVRNTIDTVEEDISGIYVKRKIVFMGKALMHGTWYPRWNLKVFKRGIGECENRWMDEHIKLTSGNTVQVEGNQIDDNLNSLTWWTEKHNSYATREMVDMLCMEYGIGTSNEVQAKLLGTSEQRLRWLKIRYLKLPFFLRPFINFIYRYIFRLGFLDGKQGFIWHFLQGFWYRFLVDAKIWELKNTSPLTHTSPLTPLLEERGKERGKERRKDKKEAERERIVAWLREKYGM